ncbi:hypothetical protein CHS0354_011418 [Potamilus streckersoni]|uniref:Uncharacterized protein n=1 Tax=Potamilus streckersoni TaxID=2493646 RepID=A0AAE0TG42_9BIVA|nr:hypothetical protein CHS0354_011418 [Potamilus streckersoni]
MLRHNSTANGRVNEREILVSFALKQDTQHRHVAVPLAPRYVNDKILLTKGPVLYSDIDDTNLYESELIDGGYKLDININCIINTSNSSEGAPGNSTTSPQYYLGIRVLNPTVNMIQGSSTTIQLQPTFPFGCSSRVGDLNPPTKCLLSVNMFDPDDSNDCKSSSISVTGSQKCGVQLPGFYYHQWTDGVSYDNVTEMTITTRDPNDYNEGRNRFVLKLLTEGTGLNDIIKGSYISNIVVTTSSETSWQGKTCYSYVDPHMRSFDGSTNDAASLSFYEMAGVSRKAESHTISNSFNGTLQVLARFLRINLSAD